MDKETRKLIETDNERRQEFHKDLASKIEGTDAGFDTRPGSISFIPDPPNQIVSISESGGWLYVATSRAVYRLHVDRNSKVTSEKVFDLGDLKDGK